MKEIALEGKEDEMFDFMKSKKNPEKLFLAADEIAEMLKTTPEALKKFEEAYKIQVLDREAPQYGDMNAKQAAESRRELGDATVPSDTLEKLQELKGRISFDLAQQTDTIRFDGQSLYNVRPGMLYDGRKPIQPEDVYAFPKELRPQLTCDCAVKDTNGNGSEVLLFYYKKMQEADDPKTKREFYNRFRQGLDILDLDPLIYAMIGTNPNSMGYWFPKLAAAAGKSGFFKIPKTVIAKVPITILQMTRLEYQSLTKSTLDIVNDWAANVFGLEPDQEYFIKTGTYSSKFDFRNAHVYGEQEVKELGEYLLYIHSQACQMAGPLNKPCIYGMSTTNEWVVREFIQDKDNAPTIYKELPLHTEYRVFVDADTDQVLGVFNYWDPEVMEKRFTENRDGHDVHDFITYKAQKGTLVTRFCKNADKIYKEVEKILPGLDLPGQWSIDIMQNGDDFWLIDMALAQNSTYYERIPKSLRHPADERWLAGLTLN